LSFVTRDGASYNLADGILRRNYVPGERTEIEIDLGATSVALAAGMRIRLDISSSNHPHFDRNPNTGEDVATATRTTIANQTILRSVDAPSRILLPVIPN
jgi:putative CocE/NonD family hydrolase